MKPILKSLKVILPALAFIAVSFASTPSFAQGKKVNVTDGQILFIIASVPQILDDILLSQGNLGNCSQRINWLPGTKLRGSRNKSVSLNSSVTYEQWLCSSLGDSQVSAKKYKVESRINIDFDTNTQILYVKSQITNGHSLPGEIGSKFKSSYTLARANMSKFRLRFNDIRVTVPRGRKDDLQVAISFDTANIPASR